MKNPLAYLTVVKLKNQLISVIKTPSKLLYGLFMVAMLVIVIYSGNLSDSAENVSRLAPEYLYAVIFAFFMLMFLLQLSMGLSKSAYMFTMSDVNIVFPAPLNPRSVLFYGLIRQAGISLLLGLVLLFQYSWLHNLFGADYFTLALIVLGYALVLVFSQISAMVIYANFGSDDVLNRRVRMIITAVAVVFLIVAAAYILPQTGSDFSRIIELAAEFLNLPAVLFFPVCGWVTGLIIGILTGNLLYMILFAALLAVSFILLVWLVSKTDQRFYEDVMQSAETMRSTIAAKKSGAAAEAVPKNVRVGKTGITRGTGASVIFHKHMLENRRSGMLFISNMSLLFVAITIICAFVFRSIGDVDSEGFDFAIIMTLVMSIYFQIFSSMLGRFSRELSRPYIYLIPEPPLKKLLWSTAENLVTSALEAVLIFVPAGIILNAPPVYVLMCMLTRLGFSLVFTAINIFIQRVFGGVSSKPLMMFFFLLTLFVMLIPSGILAALFGAFWGPALGNIFVAVLIGLTLGNVLVSVLMMFLCRGVLQCAELNQK